MQCTKATVFIITKENEEEGQYDTVDYNKTLSTIALDIICYNILFDYDDAT